MLRVRVLVVAAGILLGTGLPVSCDGRRGHHRGGPVRMTLAAPTCMGLNRGGRAAGHRPAVGPDAGGVGTSSRPW